MQIINPNGRIGSDYEAIEPPVWAGFIGIKEYAFIIDAEADNLTPEMTAAEVEEDEVLIVVMGKNPSVSSTPKMRFVRELLPYLKGKTVKLTGIHPQALKKETEDETNCEVVAYDPNDFTYSYVFDFSNYRAHNWHCLDDIDDRSPYGVLVTSFGCPFSCFYCNIHTLYPGKMIRRPLSYISTDIEALYRRGVRHVKIWDELFALSNRRVNDVCDILIRGGYKFNIWAYGRVDTVNQRMLNKMKRAGINWLAYGLDSKCDEEQIARAIEMTHEAGIHIIGNFLFGLPGEKPNDIVTLAESLDLEWVNYYVARPYPGSRWFLETKVEDWDLFDQYGTKKDELMVYRQEAFRHFIGRPDYLRRIGRIFNQKAVDHVTGLHNVL